MASNVFLQRSINQTRTGELDGSEAAFVQPGGCFWGLWRKADRDSGGLRYGMRWSILSSVKAILRTIPVRDHRCRFLQYRASEI
jgi:hypothetical protein